VGSTRFLGRGNAQKRPVEGEKADMEVTEKLGGAGAKNDVKQKILRKILWQPGAKKRELPN